MLKKPFTILSLAAICHDANKSLCETLGDHSQKLWPDAQEDQRRSALKGVLFCLENPDAPASANHESWLEEKTEQGYRYGPVKDADAKTHPCFVPYEDLPPEQQSKDHLFKAIVGALAPFTMANEELPEQTPTEGSPEQPATNIGEPSGNSHSAGSSEF